MKIKAISALLEKYAPIDYQESYDNSGLLTGDPEGNVTSILLTLDVTEEVVKEAIEKNANMIVAHHPIIFKGLTRITGSNYVERTVALAIKNDIAIYAAHTNMDGVWGGINTELGKKLNLNNIKILSPRQGELRKLVTFVPEKQSGKVREAIFEAGAGSIGNYDKCSYNIEGSGSFRGGERTDPYTGKKGKLHFEKEIRIETVFPKAGEREIINALMDSHPYEEVAYDIYPVANEYLKAGLGVTGNLNKSVNEKDFLNDVKKILNIGCIRHSPFLGKKIKKIALCGGSGSFLLNKAIAAGADAFLTSDIKYHDFFNADDKILLGDIGHFESEQIIKDVFYKLIKKKNSNFAVHFSEIITNPVKYF